MRLVLASRNPHKLRELSALLAPRELVAVGREVELPAEVEATFAENAVLKASAVAASTGQPTIGDDSGIEAAALGGAPGVRSARFAGDQASDEQNLEKLLRALAGSDDRRVAYVCALAYVEPSGGGTAERVFHGRCEGELAPVPRGSGGFGYDPAFVPAERTDGRTMAELAPEEKGAISHRGRAARALLEWLDARERRR